MADRRCEKAFAEFVDRFQKNYSTAAERERRLDIFCDNYDIIETRNAQGNPYTLGVTTFADLTVDEFTRMYGRATPEPRVEEVVASGRSAWGDLPFLGMHEYSNTSLPSSVDWRQSGAVTEIKQQAQCGACWAFASTGAVEGAWKIATGLLTPISEQQLVDCSSRSPWHNLGCQSGSIVEAMRYMKQAGLCNEASYPYSGKFGSSCGAANCRIGVPRTGVAGIRAVRQGDERALMSAVAQQPVTVAIEADALDFQLYKNGVFQKNCMSHGTLQIDHGVLVVGYGTDKGIGYWLVKNSWGQEWGDRGYMRMARGSSYGQMGQCGVLTDPVYPVVDGRKAQPPDVSTSIILGIVFVTAIGCVLLTVCVLRPMAQRFSRGRQRAPLLAPATTAAPAQLARLPPMRSREQPVGPVQSVQPVAAQALAAPAQALAAQPPPQRVQSGSGNSRASRLLQNEV